MNKKLNFIRVVIFILWSGLIAYSGYLLAMRYTLDNFTIMYVSLIVLSIITLVSTYYYLSSISPLSESLEHIELDSLEN